MNQRSHREREPSPRFTNDRDVCVVPDLPRIIYTPEPSFLLTVLDMHRIFHG